MRGSEKILKHSGQLVGKQRVIFSFLRDEFTDLAKGSEGHMINRRL